MKLGKELGRGERPKKDSVLGGDWEGTVEVTGPQKSSAGDALETSYL